MSARLLENARDQCCGSGSGSTGSPWASRILPSSCNNGKKNLDSYYFVTIFDFLSLKNDLNVPSISNEQKNVLKKLVFCWHLEGQWRKQQDPDPLVRGMDPRIRIHTKMSWIRNTARDSKKILPPPVHWREHGCCLRGEGVRLNPSPSQSWTRDQTRPEWQKHTGYQ